MKAELLNRWRKIRASYWLIPGLMSAAAVGMAAGAHQVDQAIAAGSLEALPLLYGGGAAGAREILSTIAASMITVAGVAFSTTMVALVLASSEFGPRLLEHFMRDRGTQVVLGTFICTFLYCILALRTVRDAQGEIFVPRFTVAFGIMLGVASVALFIYFIHHVIRLIQAPNVVARVAGSLDRWIDRIFPPAGASDRDRPGRGLVGAAGGQGATGAIRKRGDGGGPLAEARGTDPVEDRPVQARVYATESGYLQTLDRGYLVELAAAEGLAFELAVRPGHYVISGDELAAVRCAETCSLDMMEHIRDAFVLGDQRTADQDPEFVVQELVEVAVRSLSSGTNDPYTAVNCIDHLGSAMARIARRPMPPDRVRGPDGRVRLLRQPITFAELTCAAFDPIREYGRRHSSVLIRLLDVIESVADDVRRPDELEELRWHADKVLDSGREGLPEAPGRNALEDRYEAARERLDARREQLEAA